MHRLRRAPRVPPDRCRRQRRSRSRPGRSDRMVAARAARHRASHVHAARARPLLGRWATVPRRLPQNGRPTSSRLFAAATAAAAPRPLPAVGMRVRERTRGADDVFERRAIAGWRGVEAVRIAARWAGDVPQQPPTMRAPDVDREARRTTPSRRWYRCRRSRRRGTAARRSCPWRCTRGPGAASVIASSDTRMSLAPTPQLAPIAIGCAVETREQRRRRRRDGCPSSCGPRCRTTASPCTACRRRSRLAPRRAPLRRDDIVSIHDDVGAAGREPVDLLAERRCRRLVSERAERLEQLAERADGAGDHDRAIGGSRRPRGRARRPPWPARARGLRRLCSFRRCRAAEGVGEDDVGAGVDEVLVQLRTRSGCSTFQSSGGSPGPSPRSM